jgi:flagellar protein FliS
MNAMNKNALNAYSQVAVDAGVDTASPHKLISMLFEGALMSVAAARLHMQRKEIAEKGRAISRAIAIIDEGLKISLDVKVGGELAQNLKSLYEYMCHRLLEANISNDVEKLNEVGRLLSELKGAWEVIGRPQATVAAFAPSAQAPNRVALSYGKA